MGYNIPHQRSSWVLESVPCRRYPYLPGPGTTYDFVYVSPDRTNCLAPDKQNKTRNVMLKSTHWPPKPIRRRYHLPMILCGKDTIHVFTLLHLLEWDCCCNPWCLSVWRQLMTSATQSVRLHTSLSSADLYSVSTPDLSCHRQLFLECLQFILSYSRLWTVNIQHGSG